MIINTKLVFSDINTISARLLVKFDGNAVKKICRLCVYFDQKTEIKCFNRKRQHDKYFG